MFFDKVIQRYFSIFLLLFLIPNASCMHASLTRTSLSALEKDLNHIVQVKQYHALADAIEQNDIKMATAILISSCFERKRRNNFLNQHNLSDESLLLKAIKKGNQDLIEMLLDCGADPNITDNNGCNALHHLALQITDNPKLAYLLISHGIRINSRDNNGETALLKASLRGHINLAQILINHEAKVNLPAFNGWTPLCYALAKGHIEIAELLIAAGADERIPIDQNISQARRTGYRSIT